MKLEQYYNSYFTGKTQSIINSLPSKVANKFNDKFREYTYNIQRERYKKGLRKYPLPCDCSEHDENEYYYGCKDLRIVTLLHQYNALTANEIAYHLDEAPISIRTKLYHAVKKGEICKAIVPPNTKKKNAAYAYVSIYLLPSSILEPYIHGDL
tara:strand:- start:3128 stop:3586 length:459 start_codon:yes stop_codon:yes gene_type:complete